jgi:hypothetical protein
MAVKKDQERAPQKGAEQERETEPVFTRDQLIAILESQRHTNAMTVCVDILRARETHPDILRDVVEIREKFNSGWMLTPPSVRRSERPQPSKKSDTGGTDDERQGQGGDGTDDGSSGGDTS